MQASQTLQLSNMGQHQLENVANFDLIKILNKLSHENFSGVLKISASLPKLQQTLSCYLVFEKGEITFAERYLPSPHEFLALLGRRVKTGVMGSVIEYASRRIQGGSIRELLEIIIHTRAVHWEDIEKVLRERIVILIEHFIPYACTVDYIPITNFDISYGDDKQGFRCVDIIHEIGQRQNTWKHYLSAISSIDLIPQIRPEAFAQLNHEPTRQHLMKWVDGKRTLADIAERLDQDPLTLIPLYYRWLNEGLISLSDLDTSTTQQIALPIVLTVDDSPVVQTVIKRTLCKDYEVISAESAIKAMSILSHTVVSLVLLDITMPDIDGLDFCRTFRKIHKFKETPVIMLTSKDGLLDRAKGHLAGANRYLTKPVDREELLSAIQELLLESDRKKN